MTLVIVKMDRMTDKTAEVKHRQPGVAELLGMAKDANRAQRLQQCYHAGMALLREPTYDFGQTHDLFMQCVLGDPDNVSYVESLLVNLGQNQTQRPATDELRYSLERERIEKLRAGGDWQDVLRLGLTLLKDNPQDVEVLRAIAQACEARGHFQAEVRFLQNASVTAPQNLDLQRQLAKSLARCERFGEAVRCWQRIETLDPFDAEAPRMIPQLILEKARRGDKSLTDESGDAEPSSVDDSSAEVCAESTGEHSLQRVRKPHKLVFTARQELEQAVVNHPEDETCYLELAEFHLSENRVYDAQRTLLKALNVSTDMRILERLEDVNILRAHERLANARRRLQELDTEESRQQVQKLTDELGRLELTIFTRRCERHPEDKQLKFQLGLRLKAVGNYREALEPLQEGLSCPEQRALASLEIGEILQRYKQLPKALQCYRQAVQLAAGDESQLECRKRALYRAGTLSMNMKVLDSAHLYLSELLRLDPDYKDAETHLDKLG